MFGAHIPTSEKSLTLLVEAITKRGVSKDLNTWEKLTSTSRGQRVASARLLEGKCRHAEL